MLPFDAQAGLNLKMNPERSGVTAEAESNVTTHRGTRPGRPGRFGGKSGCRNRSCEHLTPLG